jgi:hypothetical protein
MKITIKDEPIYCLEMTKKELNDLHRFNSMLGDKFIREAVEAEFGSDQKELATHMVKLSAELHAALMRV